MSANCFKRLSFEFGTIFYSTTHLLNHLIKSTAGSWTKRHLDMPSGKPELLYHNQEIFGRRHYVFPIGLDGLIVCIDL